MQKKKINSGIRDLKLRLETITLLKGNIRETLWEFGLDKDFLDKITEAQAIKTTVNKCDYVKLRIFCTAKETFNKQQLRKWKKTFAKYKPDRGLIPRIHKKFKKFNNKTIQLGNGQAAWIGIFQKMKSKWPTNA